MKMSGGLKITATVLLFILIRLCVQAQPGSQHETVTVIGTYTPQLSEARKIGFTPDIRDTVIPVPRIDYKIVSAPIDYPFQAKPIPPAKMVGETFQKLYKNYISAGFGNYWSPFIDFSHHSYRNKKLRGEIQLKHLSAGGNLNDYAHPGYSENFAGTSGHYLMRNYTLSSGIEYKRDAVHFYGFIPDSLTPEFEKKDIRQVFNKLDFFFGGESNYLQSDRFHHNFGLKYQGLWDKYGVSEQNVLLNAGMKKQLDLTTFLKNEAIIINATGGFFSQDYNLQQISTGLAEIKPYLSIGLDELVLNVGGNLCFQLDSVGEVFFLPYGRLDIHIVPGSLGIFLGIDGAFERNTFRQLSDMNPFINTEIMPLDYTITRNILFGGINGGFGGRFNYRIMAKNRQVENLPLFVNDTLPFIVNADTITFGNRFTVVHDNVDILSVSLELQLNISRKLAVELNSAYHVYSPETQSKAWHLPTYDGNLRIVYNLDDKIYGKFNLFAYGERNALVHNTEITLKPIYDFNLELEYRFTKNLGFWARISNFTTQRHFYWNQVPSQGMNVMLGANYIF
jgi:hypothetical protein